MTDSVADPDPLEPLLEEFASQCRGGRTPSVAEFAARYPQYAARIEELFPAVALMEQLRCDEESRREALARHHAAADPPPCLGDFRILREIGRGGMGIVYEAQQQSLGRSVAIKLLPRHALLLDKRLDRFQHEARTAGRLHHTNIVEVFGAGEHAGLHYYVMPLVRGVGLDEIIRELQAVQETSPADARAKAASHPVAKLLDFVRTLTARKFPASSLPGKEDEKPGARRDATRGSSSGRPDVWRTIARIGVQAADALDYAHGQGTLHRDVKPANLLLAEDGCVFVADFGLARVLDSNAANSGDCVGTARYMAPEQLGGIADRRSDVYALGLTLYELLTLRPARDPRQASVAGCAGHVDPEVLRPRKIFPAVPRDLETIVMKCLAREPARRYQTAADLAADLRRFLEDRPIRARRASLAQRAGRWCRRNPALAAVSGLALLLLVAFVATTSASYLQTSKAYAETREALGQAEATSDLALDVLDGIYGQLAPQRVWIAWDSDPAGQACACVGLSTGDLSASSVERTASQARASGETALLLENLLVFYDRLAAQGGEDRRLALQSAIARRRVGDIRLCLGQTERAEQEYLRAAEKLTVLQSRAPADPEINTELARNRNEIGNVRAVCRDARRAWESHRAALAVLQDGAPAGPPNADYAYELARTYYFLTGKGPVVTATPASAETDARLLWPAASWLQKIHYRNSAVRLLEQLIRENPKAPDYRLLLALCCRESSGPEAAGSSRGSRGRQQAIELLEGLVAEYPAVADYRYELMATYAWIPVGLFPWQGRSAIPKEGEQSLRKALDQSQWLIARHPSVPHYARSHALILAKLGVACWRSRRLAEAEGFFQNAVHTQDDLLARFSAASPHDKVVLQFFRVRLAQAGLERTTAVTNRAGLAPSQEMLRQCVESLVQLSAKPELADDQLAQSALPLAREVLGEAFGTRGISSHQ